jgi:hypothetical protein
MSITIGLAIASLAMAGVVLLTTAARQRHDDLTPEQARPWRRFGWGMVALSSILLAAAITVEVVLL